MVSALDSGSNGPGSSPGRGHCVVFLRVSPHENHASESTVHLTDFPQIWHTCVTSLVHQPGATVWFHCLLFWRNVNQTVRQWKVFKFEVKIYSMFDYLPQV